MNPVEVYGITMGNGITVSVNASGIATVGLSLGTCLAGNFEVTGQYYLSNEVRFDAANLLTSMEQLSMEMLLEVSMAKPAMLSLV